MKNMKKILCAVLCAALLLTVTAAVFAAEAPSFTYTLVMKDADGGQISDLSSLYAGDMVNVEMTLTRDDISESYLGRGIEFTVTTKGLRYNGDAVKPEFVTAFSETQRVAGTTTVAFRYWTATGGQTFENPMTVGKFTMTVTDPAAAAMELTTRLVYLEEETAYVPNAAPTKPPVTPTEPPVTPTEPPVTPTEPPVTPTEPPVTPTEPPVTPTEPPITPTSPLVTHNLYIYGYPDGTFGPERNITREEVAAMLSRVLEYELSTPTADPFDDVSADRWSAANIAAAKEQGIMQGDGTGAFGPSKLMTRAELATVLVRIVQSQDRQFTGEEITFSDVNASAWYAEYIALAAKYGLITDYPDSTFRPDNTVTRVEAVIMINHMLDRDPETAEELKTMDFPFSDMSKSDSAYLHVMEATITHRH